MSTAHISSRMTASLRFAAQLPRVQRLCPQCSRTFSSFKPIRASSRREMQTATAYQPTTLDPPPPPPRNALPSDSPITQDRDSQIRKQWQAHSGMPALNEDQRKSAEATLQPQQAAVETSPSTSQTPMQAKPRRFNFAKRKAVIKLTPTAVERVKELLELPEPKMIRIGTKNKGCSGLAYHLEYVDTPSKLDEQVDQDGVKVLVDNRALMSIIGSEMDWVDDKLSTRFVFKNPNITEECGCGESFMVR